MEKSTRDNALFLSTAIQLKSVAFKEVFDWIQRSLRVITSPERLSPNFTIHQILNKDKKDSVLNFLRAADFDIDSVEVKEKKFHANDLDQPRMNLDQLPGNIRNSITQGTVYEPIFIREGSNGEPVDFHIREESDGNRVLFGLAGQWLEVIENGYTLVIDELHNSLHPLALNFLVSLFHNSKFNAQNAQLLFTSHETSVMTKGFMHQNQVWLFEKGEAGNSILYPLSDYKVRDVSAFQKAYLDGRFGAVPVTSGFVFGQPQ